MPQVIEPPMNVLAFPPLPRWKWTVDAYENLFTMGLLPNERLLDGASFGFELLEGDLIEKMPVKVPHAALIMLLIRAFSGALGFERLLTQFSLWVDDYNLPEPDFALAARPIADFATKKRLRPEDVSLVVEVSSATLVSDLTTKARLYARAGIRDYWVMDLEGYRLLVHRNPAADGYQDVQVYLPVESVSPLAAPEAVISVGDIFPQTGSR